MSVCSNAGRLANFNQSQTDNSSLILWFKNQDGWTILGDLVEGIVRCDANTRFGNASLNSRTLAYDNFVPDDNLYQVLHAIQSSVPATAIADPVSIMEDYILYSGVGSADTRAELQAASLSQFGYTETWNEDFYSPSLDGFASAVWNGIAHMAAALEILGRDSSVAYDGIAHNTVSGRTRDTPFFIGAIVLLAVWLICVVVATALMLRPTSCSSLDSYAAGRLLAERPDLVQGESVGKLEENERLLERFEKVRHAV